MVDLILSKFWLKFVDFLPQLMTGFVIVIVGLIVVKITINFIKLLFNFLSLSELTKKTNIISEKELQIWFDVALEVLKWIILLTFLMMAFEVWGLSRAISLLNQLLNFLPNVIISIIIAFFGFIFANLGDKIIRHSFGKIYSKTLLGFLTKTIILFFTGLIILNQLGIAQDIIRILFAGIVGMFTIAGGIAFGLGGKETAKQLLDNLKKNLS